MKRVMSGWYGWYYRYSVTIPLLFRRKERASDDEPSRRIAKNV